MWWPSCASRARIFVDLCLCGCGYRSAKTRECGLCAVSRFVFSRRLRGSVGERFRVEAGESSAAGDRAANRRMQRQKWALTRGSSMRIAVLVNAAREGTAVGVESSKGGVVDASRSGAILQGPAWSEGRGQCRQGSDTDICRVIYDEIVRGVSAISCDCRGCRIVQGGDRSRPSDGMKAIISRVRGTYTGARTVQAAWAESQGPAVMAG